MMLGVVRDNFPRVTLDLPGPQGFLRVEFVLDTGFEGELSVPLALMQRLDVSLTTHRALRLADGTLRHIPHYEISFDWLEEERLTEIIALEGRPLLGSMLLEGCSVLIEMQDGGEVEIERL
jgi:clan AA aspartic protease